MSCRTKEEEVAASAAKAAAAALKASLPQPKKIVTLIDPKRGQNAGIALARIKLPYDEVRALVARMDDSAFTTEQLKNLKEYLPAPDEASLLRAYQGDPVLLAKPERYMRAMLDCKLAARRIDVMMYKQQFKSRVTDTKHIISTIESAADDIKMSLKFKKVLKTILKVGNSMNDGEQKAFSIDSLSKLSAAKAFDNKTSILQYVVMVIHKNEPTCLLFPEELSHVADASKYTKEMITGEIAVLRKELTACVRTLEDVAKIQEKDLAAEKEAQPGSPDGDSSGSAPASPKATGAAGLAGMQRFIKNVSD
jgi:diaphanous 1